MIAHNRQLYQTINIIILFITCFLIFAPSLVSAAPPIDFKPQVPIPGVDYTSLFSENSTKPIGELVKGIYKYLVGIVGIVAVVIMMYGGLRWITAGGSSEGISEAKAWIGASLTGLVLVMGSYVILRTVNPDLINLKTTKIDAVQTLGCCDSNPCSTVPQNECKNSTWHNQKSGMSCISGRCQQPGIAINFGCCQGYEIAQCLGTNKNNCNYGTWIQGGVCDNNNTCKVAEWCCKESSGKCRPLSANDELTCSNSIARGQVIKEVCSNIKDCVSSISCKGAADGTECKGSDTKFKYACYNQICIPCQEKSGCSTDLFSVPRGIPCCSAQFKCVSSQCIPK